MRLAAAAALGALLQIHPAGAEAPLSDWLDAVGTAAKGLDEHDGARALSAALRAVRALPAGRAGARAQLLLGLAAEQLGLSTEAALALRKAERSLPDVLRPFALQHLAAALRDSGHPGLAAATFADAELTSEAAERESDRLEESRALLAAGLSEPAARAVEAMAARGAIEFQLAWAHALQALGDERAWAVYRRIWIEHAGEEDGEEAGRALLASPAFAPTASERLARAERLVATGRPHLALEDLDTLGALAGAVPPRALLLRAVALLELGRPAEAEGLAAALASPSGPEAAAAEWVLARAAARQGRLEEAARRYGRVAATRPAVAGLTPSQQADLADDSAFLAAWLWYEAGHFEEAARRLARFAALHPGAKRAGEARWFHAWALVRLGSLGRARPALAALAASESGAPRAAALYWGARLAPSRSGAASLYVQAARETPDGWYGLLASARLGEMGLSPPALAPLPAGPPVRAPTDARLASELALAEELFAAGLRTDGRRALQRASTSVLSSSSAAAIAELASFLGDAEIPFRLARDHLPPSRQSDGWLYPEAFASVLVPAATALGVDPLFAFAVMRRESSFRTAARSGAAAVGVMQLRRETAERTAQLFDLDPSVADRLLDPQTNICLGVAYLGLLVSRFPLGPVSLAAYNAGPGRVAAWAREQGATPLDQWVEDISYRETRQYVRSVVADWAHYRRLRGVADLPVDPSAPVLPAATGVAF